MKKKLFVCEKPAQVKDILKQCGDPEDDGLVFFAIGSFLFDYSHHNLLELPLLPKKPSYQYISKNENNGMVYNYKTNGLKKVKESLMLNNALKNPDKYKSEIENFFSQYEEIVFAMDYDHTGVRGFVQHFSRLLGLKNLEEIFKKYKVSIINNYIFPITESFDRRFEKINYEQLIDTENYFIEHDYEEYVFNVNSYNFFHSVFENFQKLNEEGRVFTRNHIYTLIEFSNLKNDYSSEHNLLSIMSKKEIGSVISRFEILNNLVSIGFFKKEKSIIYLTKEGMDFYNKVKNINLSDVDEILLAFEILLRKLP